MIKVTYIVKHLFLKTLYSLIQKPNKEFLILYLQHLTGIKELGMIQKF